jgi:predicted nuclease of predicted toxin-antitoxin system
VSDAEITEKGRKEERITLTCDLDFGDIMAASGGICPSIIIFRLEDQRPRNVNGRVEQAASLFIDNRCTISLPMKQSGSMFYSYCTKNP